MNPDELSLTEAFAAAPLGGPPSDPGEGFDPVYPTGASSPLPQGRPASLPHDVRHLGIELGDHEFRLRCYACDKDNCLWGRPLPEPDGTLGALRIDEFLPVLLRFCKEHEACAEPQEHEACSSTAGFVRIDPETP